MTDAELEIIHLDEIPIDDEAEHFACEDGDNLDELQGVFAFGTTSHHVKCTWLPAQLKKWGVRYKIVEGFADRGRPLSAGKFDPNGSLTHHSGATSSEAKPAPGLSTLINGRSDLKGPLCQVATDYNGVVYLIAAGRANHAGKTRATMGNPAGDGNAMYIGNEVMTNGTQKMPAAQYEATVLFAAAVADYFGQTTAAKAGLHATTSLAGKWDLGAGNGKVEPYSVTRFRADVAARLKAGPPRPPAPTPAPSPTPTRKEKDVKLLVQLEGTDPVFLSDLITRRHIVDGEDLTDVQTELAAGGYATTVKKVKRLKAYGVIVGNDPLAPEPAP